jgi:hypothetical protein
VNEIIQIHQLQVCNSFFAIIWIPQPQMFRAEVVVVHQINDPVWRLMSARELLGLAMDAGD